MKKFMKKMLSAITVAAMAFTMVVVPSVKAEAADGDYIVLGITDGGWTADTAAKMTDAGDGKYTYTFSTTAGTSIPFKIANAELFGTGTWNVAIGDGNTDGGNFMYTATDTTVTITYDSTIGDRQGVSVTGATNNKTFATGSFNFVGDEALTGANWDPSSNAMTESDGVFSITFTGISAGKYTYKILEAPTDNGDAWDSFYITGNRDAESGNGVINVAEDNTTITASIDGTTKIVTITQTVPQEEDSNEDTSNEDTSNEDTSNEDASNEDASNEDASNEDTSNEDSSNGDSSNEDSSNEDTSNEDASNDNNDGNGNGGTGNGEGDVPAGIATPIVVISLVAIAAFAGAVICAKKKVTE